ncbi:MAG: tetratricopeptide repeat protein [Treponema sp.]|nr:tetratricopeptide repeat protein [Treponema sp.]
MRHNFNIKKIFALLIVFVSMIPLFAAESGTAAYVQGCKAFSDGDWDSAVFLLKKAVAYPDNDTADANYMLIQAEIYSGDERSALSDCDDFLLSFPKSAYSSRISFTKGKILYNLGEYDKAIVVLSDFCHQNENDGLYASALFYIAESLYSGYKYKEAESIYETIVTKYSESDKVSAAQYRIDSIAQHSREEKLLYLLKQTGEEYLAAKEDYEKQLRLYNSEAINTTREKLVESQLKNRELEAQIKNLETQILELKNERDRILAENQKGASELGVTDTTFDQEVTKDDSVRNLKEKALMIQYLLDSQKKNTENSEKKDGGK